MFQLILPFQLELPFEAEGSVAGARSGGTRPRMVERTPRARRSRRESVRSSLAFDFSTLTSLQED